MKSMTKAAAPALSALALVFAMGTGGVDAASTNTPPPQTALKAQPAQQQVQVQCYLRETAERNLKDQFNMSVRESVETPVWENLKIYANNRGGWFLIGEPKDNAMIHGATKDMKISCLLEGDSEGNTYGKYPADVHKKPWYKQFFEMTMT